MLPIHSRTKLGCPNVQPSTAFKKQACFFLRVAYLFLMVGLVLLTRNFIINLVIFQAIFDARVPGVMLLCDKELLLGAKIDWYICGPHAMRKAGKHAP